MKQKLTKYVGTAVDNDLFDKIWALSVHEKTSIAILLRKYLKLVFNRLYSAIPEDKISTILSEVERIRGKK